MDLILTSYVKKLPDPNAVQHSRYCREVKNDHRKAKKNKEPAIPQKVTKIPKKAKECKKCGKRKADHRKSDLCRGRSPDFDPYQTTFQREFVYRPIPLPEAIRPGSSNGFTFPFQLHEPIGDTVYSNNYSWKHGLNQQPIRHGTSSGSKTETIPQCPCSLLFKLLMKDPETFDRVKAYFVKSLSSEDMGRLNACQYDTIYRQDYLGIQQACKMKCPPCLPIIRKPGQPKPPVTDNKHHSRKRDQKPELAVCTTRYGSNKHWKVAAKGVVPNLTQAHIKNQEFGKQPTTYEREYGNINMDFAKILKSLEPKAIQSYLSSLPNKDQEVLLQFLDTVAVRSETK
ncbi:testis-expressed protein 26-like [Chiloscyllium plagiosum]|uniref:testis-expressed protein 26-like n=1 Tax=Chiloscyllium plagiosum TaxID=36176 RepID=UPI001CB849A7|nr:testis-expressed protein 26-like [Chiloscyllium plagiosum]XP_043547977.1 testis-expressed protein 26-like [Chiloscyllium plagiosum]